MAEELTTKKDIKMYEYQEPDRQTCNEGHLSVVDENA
jgi:hypothetical protein